MTARRRPLAPTREQLLVLADRAERGPLTAAEASRLRAGIRALAFSVRSVGQRHRRQRERQDGQLVVLRRALARLHYPMPRGGDRVCPECSGWDGRRCRGPLTPWPCRTAEAAGIDHIEPKEQAA